MQLHTLVCRVLLTICAVLMSTRLCSVSAGISNCSLNMGYLLCNNISHAEFVLAGRDYQNFTVSNLICNQCSIVNIPKKLVRHWYRSLTTILISNNQNDLVLDEHNFRQLYELTSLKFPNTNVVNLRPGVFRDLTNLSELELSRNKFSKLPDKLFDKLGGLTVLNLSRGKLTSLDKNVFIGVTTIERLFLQENLLRSFPDEVFLPLNVLKELDISGNPLTTLNYHSLPIGLSTLKILRISGLPCDTLRDLLAKYVLPTFNLEANRQKCLFYTYRNCTAMKMIEKETERTITISERFIEIPKLCTAYSVACKGKGTCDEDRIM